LMNLQNQWGASMRRYGICLLTIVAMAGLPGCNFVTDPSDNNSQKNTSFVLFGNYTHSSDTLNFTVDRFSTSSAVTFGRVTAHSSAPHKITLMINNLAIYDGTTNYDIVRQDIHEEVDGQWVVYTEFEHAFPRLTGNIGVVLVLDASNSLGNDFANVKAYAEIFINTVFAETKYSAKCGVVSFSDSVHHSEMDDSPNDLITFVKAMTQGEYTKLYDGMKRGIDMLSTLPDSVPKALVTFTDGRDNFSLSTSSAIIAALEDHNIKSFAIGFVGKGELDESLMTRLAYNGAYEKADNLTDLEKVFRTFSKSVTQAYTVTYTRNDQHVFNRRIRFTLHCSPKA